MLGRGAMMRRASRLSVARCALPAAQHVRNLNIHEYQSAALMKKMGVNVPFGIAVHTVEEAVAAAAEIGDEEVVIKSQILAGGRGLGTFTNGLQGGVHIIKSSEVEEYAGKMLGGTLVTKQTGPAGKPVNTLLLAKKMELVNEMYFAILLDRVRAPLSVSGPIQSEPDTYMCTISCPGCVPMPQPPHGRLVDATGESGTDGDRVRGGWH
jgi:succinyl-CoA synthetase beta subunit